MARSSSRTRRSAPSSTRRSCIRSSRPISPALAPERRLKRTAPTFSGSGKKPWKQKGTGRARVGSIRSPIWVGGGRTFAARPRSFEQKVNRKMYRGRDALGAVGAVRQERLIVTPELGCRRRRRRSSAASSSSSGFTTGLIIVEAFDMKLWLAARNLPNVDVLEAQFIDPVSLVGADKVVVTAAALKIVEERVR